ncbi:MAG: acyl-CoA thioesterase [Chitinophagaceae bacterium]
MPRIRIELPTDFRFHCNIPIRISDVNYGGHVGNDSILSIIHEARLQYLHHIGYTELDFAGRGLIMADVAIEFKSESFYGDQLKVYVKAGEFNRVGFVLFYKLVKMESSSEKLIAQAQTGMICYDYQLKKVASVPESALNRMNGTFIP